MGTELLLSAGCNKNNIPYRFNTGVRVYSLEEALFHCYYNWRGCLDFFLEEGFILWVRNELKLSRIANDINEIRKIGGLCDRFIAFLRIIYYFDEEDITRIEKELRQYERRSKSEIFKEQGDGLFRKEMYEGAIDCYRLALKEDSENFTVINNMGLCRMRLGQYEEAVKEYEKAFGMMPVDKDILYNLTEGYIFCKNYEKAEKCLQNAEKFGKNADYYYYKGEILFRNSEYEKAAENFIKSVENEKNEDILMKISDCYIRIRKYNAAEEVLNKYGEDSMNITLKKAEIAALRGNAGGAVKIIEGAIIHNRKNSSLWTKLAQYYRKSYDFINAQRAIMTALSFDRENREAELERARIKKSMGDMAQYREYIKKIIEKLKRKYNEK